MEVLRLQVEVEASRQAHIHPFNVQPEQIKASCIPSNSTDSYIKALMTHETVLFLG